jgi:hypothetical protein
MSEEQTITVDGLEKAIEHVDKLGAEAQIKFEQFKTNFYELTGKQINEPVTAIDVLKIVRKVWGDPK